MAQNERNRAITPNPRTTAVRDRTATVVHDGLAFGLAAALRNFGFDVNEGPVLSFASGYQSDASLAILATQSKTTRAERLREWTRQLCSRGATVVAVGASVGPVAEFFGSSLGPTEAPRPTGRLASVTAKGGLFAGAPKEFRLALPESDRVECSELTAEFGVTAQSRDGELVGASHIFRPIHLLHTGVLESTELQPIILNNLVRLVRDRGGRAF